MNLKNPSDAPRAAEIARFIEAGLIERMDALGIKPLSKKGAEAEVNYIAGAAKAMHAMFPPVNANELSSAVPPSWIFNPMSGRSCYVEFKMAAKERAKKSA